MNNIVSTQQFSDVLLYKLKDIKNEKDLTPSGEDLSGEGQIFRYFYNEKDLNDFIDSNNKRIDVLLTWQLPFIDFKSVYILK